MQGRIVIRPKSVKYDLNGRPAARPSRRSLRLKGYDYSWPGAYFITIVTQDRACLFGEVVDGEMRLNEAGRRVEKWWAELHHKFPNVQTDEFVIMPNHFHGIVMIMSNPVGADLCVCPDETDAGMGAHVGADLRVCPDNTDAHMGAHTGAPLRVCPDDTGAHAGAPLPEIVQWFKTMTTNEYIRGVKQSGWPPFRGRLWQRNYYEHIIRNDDELRRIREYITDNPLRWALDRENPDVVGAHGRAPLPKDEPWRA
jgi:REP element-mobilizing transposase RayT